MKRVRILGLISLIIGLILVLNSASSITGFVVLALRYAEDMGVEIPPTIKARLNVWVDFIQHDENGGSGYTEPDDPEQGQNLLRTGSLLFQLAFLGDTLESQEFNMRWSSSAISGT